MEQGKASNISEHLQGPRRAIFTSHSAYVVLLRSTLQWENRLRNVRWSSEGTELKSGRARYCMKSLKPTVHIYHLTASLKLIPSCSGICSRPMQWLTLRNAATLHQPGVPRAANRWRKAQFHKSATENIESLPPPVRYSGLHSTFLGLPLWPAFHLGKWMFFSFSSAWQPLGIWTLKLWHLEVFSSTKAVL